MPPGSQERAGLGCRTDANVRLAAPGHDDLLTARGAIQDGRVATKGAKRDSLHVCHYVRHRGVRATFPQGLTLAYGKSYGRYSSLGDAVTIDEYERRPPISDRINLSVSRRSGAG
jgi:hypothetical protein